METATIDLNKYHEMKAAYNELARRKSKQEFEEVRITTTLYVTSGRSPYFQKTIYTSNPDKGIQEMVTKIDEAMTHVVENYNKELAKKHKAREDIDRLEKENKEIWKKMYIYNIITLGIGLATGLFWSNLF